MERATPFSYQCNRCGLCCHDKVITLSPCDVIAVARAASISTGEALRRYTARRGSLLRFRDDGACSALEANRCGLHRGRPLACRLYPLGIERDRAGERIVALEPMPGSLGVFGADGTAGDFIDSQGAASYLAALENYRALVPVVRARVAAMVDFERVEPREFWRHAVVEALLENGFDPNPIIDAIFDPDSLGCRRESEPATVAAHVGALRELIEGETDPQHLAAAGVMLAVSLGYAPGEVIAER